LAEEEGEVRRVVVVVTAGDAKITNARYEQGADDVGDRSREGAVTTRDGADAADVDGATGEDLGTVEDKAGSTGDGGAREEDGEAGNVTKKAAGYAGAGPGDVEDGAGEVDGPVVSGDGTKDGGVVVADVLAGAAALDETHVEDLTGSQAEGNEAGAGARQKDDGVEDGAEDGAVAR
jgi:hypothetical protein